MRASKLLHRILKFIHMQIYANLFQINEKCHLSSIQKSQQICTSGGDVYYASRNLLSTCIILQSFVGIPMSSSLDRNFARICDTTQEQFSPDCISIYTILSVSWISIDRLIMFNHKCMDYYLSPSILKYERGGRCIS